MSYQYKMANFKKLSRTASNIAIISATAIFTSNLVMAAERHNTVEKPPTIELHFEVLDKLSDKKKDPFAPVVHDGEPKPDVFSAPTNMPFSTKPSEPLPEHLHKKPSAKAKKPTKPKKEAPSVTVKKPEVEPEIEKKIEPAPAQKPLPNQVEELPEIKLPDATPSKVIESKPEPVLKEPELLIPSTPKVESKPSPEPIITPTPKEPEMPIPLAPNAPLPKAEPIVTPVIPTDDTTKLPVPPAPKVEAKPEPVAVPVIPAPKEPELPVPSKPEAVSNEKASSVAITPMPPAPSPTEEFMKALNVPVEADKKPAPEANPIIPTEVKPVILTEPAKEETAKPAIPTGNLLFSIKFISTETTLPLSVEEDLKKLAETLKKQNKRVTLFSYASESVDQATTARRVSLSRVLAVRAFLLENGVDKLNINVRAEGSKNPGGEPNRVDIAANDEKTN